MAVLLVEYTSVFNVTVKNYAHDWYKKNRKQHTHQRSTDYNVPVYRYAAVGSGGIAAHDAALVTASGRPPATTVAARRPDRRLPAPPAVAARLGVSRGLPRRVPTVPGQPTATALGRLCQPRDWPLEGTAREIRHAVHVARHGPVRRRGELTRNDGKNGRAR